MDAIFDCLHTGIICTDERLAVVDLNTAAQMLFMLSARQSVGRDIAAVVPALAPFRARLARVMDDNAGLTMRRCALPGPDGGEHTVDFTAVARPEPDDRCALILEFQPIDRWAGLSQADDLRAAAEANREMIRGLAHEIKNPLGGLRGAAQLLEQQLEDRDLREYTAVIQREVERLGALVEAMIGPSRPPDKRPLNIHEPLEHAAALTGAKLEAGVTLRRDYDPSIPRLHADADQLVQVYLNLLDNAATAVDGRGTIRIVTRIERLATIGGVQYRQAARIDIVDDGPGIAGERIGRIFQPMVSSKARGGGLGLPIAQYLVGLHAGVIDCRSTPGHTVFSVLLPLEGDDD